MVLLGWLFTCVVYTKIVAKILPCPSLHGVCTPDGLTRKGLYKPVPLPLPTQGLYFIHKITHPTSSHISDPILHTIFQSFKLKKGNGKMSNLSHTFLYSLLLTPVSSFLSNWLSFSRAFFAVHRATISLPIINKALLYIERLLF